MQQRNKRYIVAEESIGGKSFSGNDSISPIDRVIAATNIQFPHVSANDKTAEIFFLLPQKWYYMHIVIDTFGSFGSGRQ